MIRRFSSSRVALGALAAATILLSHPAHAATKQVDLDGNAANGAESSCELNILQTFPVKIENKVTNKAAGDAYTFTWISAGPGGFTSSLTPGSTGGVGAKWTWTTNQTVYAYTGTSCATDICFAQTTGPDSSSGTCSFACLSDDVVLSVAKGAQGSVVLTWTGGVGPFTIYRSNGQAGVAVPLNAVGSVTTQTFTDTPPTDINAFYVVRGAACTAPKSCLTSADCSAPGDGTCVNRGPFGVPGRSLLSTDVTVSAASLTSSLITFFSPPKEVFRATSTASAGGTAESVLNAGTSPVTVNIPAYPPGCCPPNPDVPHQLRCGDTCVDYLNDPDNCGACGNVCGVGTCCSNGNCASLCGEGQTWCNGECADLQNDSANCGACGNSCGEGTCCNGGTCASLCAEGQVWCNNQCVDLQSDNGNCGTCGNACNDGSCCSGGFCASLCAEGQVWCNNQCVDLRNDSANCGTCGVACGAGTCCNDGSCESFCAEGQVLCGTQCVDFRNDNANCGACGNACGDGTCCNNSACVSVCGEGQVWCNGQCVNLQNDSANCGTCGTACGAGTCCNGGSCESFCPAGQVLCGNQCVDFQNDSDNCGACGNVCAAGSCCHSGSCESFCPAGQVLCGNQCVDLQNDSANCGACGNACGDGTCCHAGSCESFCAPGRVWCNGQCVDLQNDSANCGSCGTACGDGTCCNSGSCESFCPAGQVLCGNQCVDFQNDSDNCGSCGHACGDGTCCNGGSCVSECPAGKTYCNGVCVDLNSDPGNCGTCGHVCGHHDTLNNGHDDDNRCHNGSCEHDDLYSPLNDPPPVPAYCPNTHPTHPAPGYCHNSTPSTPVPGYCHNETPTHPAPGYCHNETPTHPAPGYCHNTNPTDPVPGYCPNTTPTTPTPGYCHNTAPTNPMPGYCPNDKPTTPVGGYCPNTNPSSGPVPGYCPEGQPDPPVPETPTCTVAQTTQTIPPGGTSTICNQGGVLFKEVSTAITVCGDGIPGVDGTCGNAAAKVTTGTFNRLVPDTSKTVGNAYVTPYAVHITSDASHDGLLEPGETANLVIDVLNAGPMNITQAHATLTAPVVDLTDDGVVNPIGIGVGCGSSAYGTILGTPVSTNCTAPPPHPASNSSAFQITVPAGHPGDTSHPFNLAVTGMVNGAPFTMNVPLTLGIADACDPAAHNRDYDGLDGLFSPMTKLVPDTEPVPFPVRAFNAGANRLLKLDLKCGCNELDSSEVDAPQIVALSEATRGPIDVSTLWEQHHHTHTPFFIWQGDDLTGNQLSAADDYSDDDLTHDHHYWVYQLGTSDLGTGTFTITIRIAGRKDYVTGFVLH